MHSFVVLAAQRALAVWVLCLRARSSLFSKCWAVWVLCLALRAPHGSHYVCRWVRSGALGKVWVRFGALR